MKLGITNPGIDPYRRLYRDPEIIVKDFPNQHPIIMMVAYAGFFLMWGLMMVGLWSLLP